MINEDKLHTDTARADRAKRLLEDELIQEAFQALHDEYIAAWKITHLNDDKGRERLWQAINLLGKVQSHLSKVVDGGKLAAKQIAAIKYLKP